jgi:hypothetical protein
MTGGEGATNTGTINEELPGPTFDVPNVENPVTTSNPGTTTETGIGTYLLLFCILTILVCILTILFCTYTMT